MTKIGKMTRNSLFLGIYICILAGIIAVSTTSVNVAQAEVIVCTGPNECLGTENADNMLGDDTANLMIGSGGNDLVNGKGGADRVIGSNDNDIVSGGAGPDTVLGGFAADKLIGGNDDDKVYQSVTGAEANEPDGGKDTLDCGPGNDEAWINFSVDHDVAVNCETVHGEIIVG